MPLPWPVRSEKQELWSCCTAQEHRLQSMGTTTGSSNHRQADESPEHGTYPSPTRTDAKVNEASAAYLIAAVGEASHANGCVFGDGAFTAPRQDNHDKFDLSGWQEEIETEAPP